MSSLNLEGTPPPPYTAELPEAHCVLQRASSYTEPVPHADMLHNAYSDDTIATDFHSDIDKEPMRDDTLCRSLNTNETASMSREPQLMKDMENQENVLEISSTYCDIDCCSDYTDLLPFLDKTSSEVMLTCTVERKMAIEYEPPSNEAHPNIVRQKDTALTIDSQEMDTPTASTSTAPTSLLDDIKNFKHSMLRQTEETTAEPTIAPPNKQQPNTTD